MNQAETNSALSLKETLLQMVKVLGFHDLASFFAVSVFVIAALAFLIAMTVFFVRKRKERKQQLEQVVSEVQSQASAQAISDKSETPVKTVEETTGKREAQTKLDKVEAIVAKKSAAPKTALEEVPHDQKAKTKSDKAVKHDAKAQESIRETPSSAQVPAASKEPAADVKPKVEDDKDAKLDAKAHTSDQESLGQAASMLSEIVPSEVPVGPETKKPSVDAKKQLGAALSKTRTGVIQKLLKLFSHEQLDEEAFEDMEAILFTADIGVKTAQKLLDSVREQVRSQKAVDKSALKDLLKREMLHILESAPQRATEQNSDLRVLMFVGVNGAGKTTSIGKMGARLKELGKSVLFGAGDTFRAAAQEQLAVWGSRVGAQVITGKEQSDSASVLFDAIAQAKKDGVDYVLCDTAGRLHTKVSLMEELKKVHRVVGKATPGAPHEVFLVIDATMGQNAINQAREFAAATPLTGVILSKLDGTAKGGVALGIVDQLGVPIRYVGIGEKVSDLRDFDAKQFVDALFEEA